jgi:hypothetical protein
MQGRLFLYCATLVFFVCIIFVMFPCACFSVCAIRVHFLPSHPCLYSLSLSSILYSSLTYVFLLALCFQKCSVPIELCATEKVLVVLSVAATHVTNFCLTCGISFGAGDVRLGIQCVASNITSTTAEETILFTTVGARKPLNLHVDVSSGYSNTTVRFLS